ncbi:MAG: alpha/beta hydrolase [Proteobacteria bacterium]|nr:alpha/beta hydrolase [Pseudomonadota bacterium]
MRGKWLALGVLPSLLLAGCGDKNRNVLTPIAQPAPGTSRVDMLVLTTRLPTSEPGQMFSGERGQDLSFAEIAVSIPPDSSRKVGEVQWPSSDTPDPEREFATLHAKQVERETAALAFRAALRRQPQRRVLVFVHGYNMHFTDAVFDFAQFMHDSRTPAVPILFTWPSRGKLLAYGFDRESTAYSRDALEGALTRLSENPEVKEITVLAHSMGTWLTMETLRQMGIRNGRVPAKIREVILAAPDIDIDVFKRQVPALGSPRPGITVMVSQDDKALAVSRQVSQSSARLGAINPNAEPLRSELTGLGIRIADLTGVKSDDSLGHGKFSSSPLVVQAIGKHLSAGHQFSSGAGGSLAYRAGALLTGTASVIVNVPLAIVDKDSQEELKRSLDAVGAPEIAGHPAQSEAPKAKEP